MKRALLVRRRRLKRRGNGKTRGSSVGRGVAVALPLFLLGTLAAVGFIGFVVAVSAYSVYSQGLGDPIKLLDSINFEQQTVVYDSTGKVELARFGQQKRVVVTYRDLPPVLVDATTSVEDKTFWQNAGFDPLAIVKAGYDSLTGRARGASTVTQQLVRARLLSDSVLQGSSVDRKIKEIIQSARLTQELPPGDAGKQQIMQYYLNQNFYGNQSYGVAAAAKSYFGITDLRKLTIAQAAILAAIPQSPTDYDLVQNAVVKHDAKGNAMLVVPATSAIVVRRNYVLDQMKQFRVLTAFGKPGAITDAQLEAAKKEPVVLARQLTPNWRAPHFVWQVRLQLGTILCPQTPTNCPAIDVGGYSVRTTLDWNMQKSAEKWVQAAVLGPHAPNTATYLKALNLPDLAWIENLRGNKIFNGALIAMDYRTGGILAYVGSAQYYSSAKTKQFQPQFDVLANGWRQPGSAFKPINYITGFEDHTITPATGFMDVATDFGGGYVPTDADQLERGPLRMRQALMFSLNIPAVKAAAISGPGHIFDEAKKLGLTFRSKTNPAGDSIGIGTLEIHPADLIRAYGAIANQGVLVPQTAILSISTPTGAVLWPSPSAKATGKQVVSPQAAYLMTNILEANTDPAQNPFWGKAAIMSGNVRRPAALKTGTTNDTKDLMSYGFTAPPKDPNQHAIAVGVWMGNSDNSQTGGIFSLEGPTPLWQSFLTEATATQPVVDFQQPPGIVHATVDNWSGLLPGPFTTKTVDEVFINGTVPTKRDDTKVGIDIDAATGKLWAADCTGPKKTSGFLDLSGADAAFPQWQSFDQEWIARARQGAGVRGGPAVGTKTATAFFYEPIFEPNGASWGAPFPPTETCTPKPSPSPSAPQVACPPGGVELNPDGTLVLDANGQPIPCPTAPPTPTVCPPGAVELNPDGTPVLDQNGQPIPCPTTGPPSPSLPPGPTPEPTIPPTPAPTPGKPTPTPTVPNASV